MLKFIKILRQAFFKTLDKNFFSQFGEDRILNEIFISSKTNGFYVDVGCYHPIKHSNTYRFHKKGWSGINIDIERDKIQVFNLTRKSDHNVLAPVSSTSEIVKICSIPFVGKYIASILSNFIIEQASTPSN